MTANDRMIRDAVTPVLENVGFKKRADLIYTIDLAEGAIGRVGLNNTSEHCPRGEVEVNPVVGVRHQEVERLVAELSGEKFHAYLPSTISTPIGYVMPEARYLKWIFNAGCAEAEAADMAVAIEEYGLAFMRAHTDLKDICRALEPRSGFMIEWLAIYRRPVAWYVAGDMSRASGELDKALADVGDRDDPAADEFREFAAAFRARLAQEAETEH